MMKQTRIYYNLLLTALLALCLVACGNDDDSFTPGPQIADSNPGVFFSSSNSATLLRGEDEAKSVSILLQRTNKVGELKVPIIVKSKSKDVTVDDYAIFLDGKDTATIRCSYENLDATPTFEIAVSEEYGNPYTIKKGSTCFGASIYKLNTICSSVYVTPYTASSNDFFSGVTGQGIYQLGHDNHFIWKNFLGSGIDLEFEISGTFDADDITKCMGGVLPLNHNWDDDYGWYLMSEAKPSDYPEDDSACAKWTPNGSSTYIGGYMYFYRKYESTEYFYIDFSHTPAVDTDGNPFFYSYGWISSAIVSENGRGTTEKEKKSYNTYYVYLYY